MIPSRDGRVLDGGKPVPGWYVTGWIKRGPSGIIGTNREDSVLTVNGILADLGQLDGGAKGGAERVAALLQGRGVRVVSYADWRKIDAAEIRRGEAAGKPREKFTRLKDMLEAAAARELDRVAG